MKTHRFLKLFIFLRLYRAQYDAISTENSSVDTESFAGYNMHQFLKRMFNRL